MAEMLASDLNNPNFVGARNPDSSLAVVFYPRAIQNEFESEKEGRPIFYDVDFVKILLPGDSTLTVDVPVREEHKKRFPFQWQHYINKRQGDQIQAGRTPLTEWPRLSPAQVESLRGMKFFSVEDIAHASDMQLQAVGMVAGMSPFAFREAAQRFLQVASAEAKESAAAKELQALKDAAAKKDEENAKQMQELRDQIAALTAAFKPAAAPTETKPKKAS